jgi:hypothetical protein
LLTTATTTKNFEGGKEAKEEERGERKHIH